MVMVVVLLLLLLLLLLRHFNASTPFAQKWSVLGKYKGWLLV